MKVLISTGGTGGHVYPALAVAEALKKRNHEVILVSDKRGSVFLGKYMVECVTISVPSPKGGLLKKIKFMPNMMRSIYTSVKLVMNIKPDIIFGFGGYATLPIVTSATVFRIPLIIHEQNAVPGDVNSIYCRFAKMVLTSFPDTQFNNGINKRKIHLVGNPIREKLVYKLTIDKIDMKNDGFNILIIGGSQGASIFSSFIPEVIASVADSLSMKITVSHQCRPEDCEKTKNQYDSSKIEAEVADFFTDIDERLLRADIVISRSGASTVSENLLAGKPAIYVPYPFAKNNHQTMNALYACNADAAFMIPQEDFSADKLKELLEKIIVDKTLIQEMSKAAIRASFPDAANKCADFAEKIVSAKSSINK